MPGVQFTAGMWPGGNVSVPAEKDCLVCLRPGHCSTILSIAKRCNVNRNMYKIQGLGLTDAVQEKLGSALSDAFGSLGSEARCLATRACLSCHIGGESREVGAILPP